MLKFRQKPATVEAVQYTPNKDVFAFFMLKDLVGRSLVPYMFDDLQLGIETFQGFTYVNPGDWVVKDAKGKLYVYDPEEFNEIYEAVEE